MTITPCPWCGNDVGVYQNMVLEGTVRELYDTNGQPCGLVSKARRIPYSSAVRCRVCGHVRRDWMAVEGELRKVDEGE